MLILYKCSMYSVIYLTCNVALHSILDWIMIMDGLVEQSGAEWDITLSIIFSLIMIMKMNSAITHQKAGNCTVKSGMKMKRNMRDNNVSISGEGGAKRKWE